MKKIAGLFLITLLFAACKQTPANGNYGKTITEDGAVSIDELVAQLDGKEEMPAKVKGTVKAVCKSEGCWYTLETAAGEEVTIMTKDHSFSLPKDSEGKTAIAEGIAKVEIIPVEKQKHLAEDAGKTPEEIAKITAPSREVTFEATGVILK